MKKIAPITTAFFILILLLLLPNGRTNGCGDYFNFDEYRIALFNPGLVDDPALRTFNLYFNIPFNYEMPDPEHKDYQRNCQEWSAYLGPEVKIRDIYKVLYQTKPDIFLSAAEDQSLLRLLPGNTFIQKLLEPAHLETLNYLKLAMRAEFAHFSTEDPWGLDESTFDFYQKITPVIKTAREKVKSLQDSFLIRRYAYQLVLQSRYTGSTDEGIEYCDTYFGLDKSSSILVPWAQFHKAEMLTDSAEANYIFSRVFDLCESKKNRVHQLSDPSSLEKALKLAHSPHEKATIHAVLGFKSEGKNLPDLQKIAELDPNLRYLPQLIIREINKVEDWLLTARITFFGRYYHDWYLDENPDEEDESKFMPSETFGLLKKEIPYLQKNLAKDLAYLRQLRQLLETLIADPRFQQHDFAHLAAAHLYYLDQKPNEASLHLDKIKNDKQPSVQLQKNIIKLLLLPDQIDITTLPAKEEIARAFNRVKEQVHLLDPKLRIYPKLMLYFSRLYQKKGDVVTAGLLYNRSQRIPVNGYMASSQYYGGLHYFDRFASLKDMDALIALAKKEPRTTFETLLTDTLSRAEKMGIGYSFYGDVEAYLNENLYPPLPSIEQLYELKGTIAFRHHQLNVALEAFEHLPPTYWRDTYDFRYYLKKDPFADAQHLPWEGTPLEAYNKAAVVKKMIELQNQINQPGPKQAENCYMLANAYWNVSFWGQSWMMYSYGQSLGEYNSGNEKWISHGNFLFYTNADDYYNVYYKMSRAIDLYKKVLQCKPTDELAARAVYMLGYCEKHVKIVNGEIKDYEYWESRDEKPYISPIFNTLRDKFGHTAFYEECLRTCPELADYFKN